MRSVWLLALAASGCRAILGIGDPPALGDGGFVSCEGLHPEGFDPCALTITTDKLALGGAAYTYDTSVAGGTLYDAAHQAVVTSDQMIMQSDGSAVAVLAVGELTTAAGSTLAVVGPRPLLIASWSSITLDGALDAGSHLGVVDAAAHIAQTIRFGAGANQGCTGSAGHDGGPAMAGGSGGGGGGSFQAAGGGGGQGGIDAVAGGAAGAVAAIAILHGGQAARLGGLARARRRRRRCDPPGRARRDRRRRRGQRQWRGRRRGPDPVGLRRRRRRCRRLPRLRGAERPVRRGRHRHRERRRWRRRRQHLRDRRRRRRWRGRQPAGARGRGGAQLRRPRRCGRGGEQARRRHRGQRLVRGRRRWRRRLERLHRRQEPRLRPRRRDGVARRADRVSAPLARIIHHAAG